MHIPMRALSVLTLLALRLGSHPSSLPAPKTPRATPIESAFATGWLLVDTNDNGIPDFVHGHLVVPRHPTAAENAASANLAARIGYSVTGLTLPLVISVPDTGSLPEGPKIFVGLDSLPPNSSGDPSALVSLMGTGEGGVFLDGSNLAVAGADAPGLLAAATDYSARAPFQWETPGDKLQLIAQRVNQAFDTARLSARARLVGLTYVDREPGIRRAILRIPGQVTSDAIRKALAPPGRPPLRFVAIHELVFLLGDLPPITLLNPVPLPARPLGPAPPPGPKPLDLGTLYTIDGLLGGAKKMPLPASVDSRLYVPAGAPGVAMANLAARMGLETTGISLPLAFVPAGVSPAQVQTQAVVTSDSSLGKRLAEELSTGGGKDQTKSALGAAILTPLGPGEGELRTIERAFGKHSALLVRGDVAGQTAALDYASGRLPYLWQPDKRFESTAEIRYDLHRFFSLRSAAGQAGAALYHLDRWLTQIRDGRTKPASMDATIFVDRADPQLASFVQSEIQRRLPGAKVAVHTGSLHAGLRCCEADPPQHYVSPLQPFQQGPPSFRDDFTIPWEGRRLLEAVRGAAGRIHHGQPVSLLAEVSEDEAMRSRLAGELRDVLVAAGADPGQTKIEVLCAYKPGYSWLMDEIVPALKGRAVSRLVIEFAPDVDPENTSLLYSSARWVQELYPVDEMLVRALRLPLKNIEFREMPNANGPTYRVHAYGPQGTELLTRDYTVHTAERPYSSVFPRYDHVQVDTGWVRLQAAGQTLLDQRVETDVEMFWDHYQTVTLPRIFHFLMAQNGGKPLLEYQPLFDTLRLKIHLSEPDYDLGLDRERISSLESLEEDAFYSTSNFFYMMGTLESSGIFDYMGRVIPIVYPSADGQDGRVQIDFYAKDGPHPLVELKWTDAAGGAHERKRDLPALAMGMPRLVAARVRAGQPGVEALTWRLPVDSRQDHYQDWIAREDASRVEHSMFSAEQGSGQLHWLQAMHAAGLYGDSLAYPDLSRMAMEFELPRPLRAPENGRPQWVTVDWAVPKPATARPQISDVEPVPAPASDSQHFVSWNEPISPAQDAAILARLARYPGVTVYWMGHTYLGENIWAADLTLPSPAKLRSAAKEETLKGVIVYSGRQHANEVSSTSHILRLGEELVLVPATRELLKKVNVVLHPIDNPDGANLSIDLMRITPNFLLHPGYHGSLTADVSSGEWETDPIYPESRTRRLLWESWLPDAFLNPHGYPSHEWVQPFSGYTAWVIRRMGVESGYSWWIPRGWFTSLGYLADPEHALSKDVAYELRERIAEAIGRVPGAAALNARMNARYDRYGVRWEPRRFQQPVYKGVRVYMGLKGTKAAPGGGSFMSRFPDVTWDEGYTEAPDETAHGVYLRLVAGEGLAYDRVHLDYLANGKFELERTEKEFSNAVNWKVTRKRPVVPNKWLIQPGPGVEDQ